MIFLSFRTVEKQKYRIQAEKGEELLKTLDKFLKKNKIKIASIKNWYIDFFEEKSITSQRISQSILHALKFYNLL
jgi:predicted DNA-binding protein with PD1-like motif